MQMLQIIGPSSDPCTSHYIAYAYDLMGPMDKSEIGSVICVPIHYGGI